MRRCDLLTEIREFRAQAVELRECRTLAEEALRLSYQTLRLEMPDTFLGRSRFASAEESLKAPPPIGHVLRIPWLVRSRQEAKAPKHSVDRLRSIVPPSEIDFRKPLRLRYRGFGAGQERSRFIDHAAQ